MLVNEALSFIKEQLKVVAKKEIVSKYNATNEQIKGDFEYYENENLVYRHQFAVISEDVILQTLYYEMLSLCVSQTPISLLVEKGVDANDIVRNYDNFYDIRKPKSLSINEKADIDEPLFLASIYNTLSILGVNDFRTKAKEVIGEYERNLIIPSLKVSSDLNFRFSKDKNAWHFAYENGDNYFSIYKNGSWGEAIPLISGSGGGGVSISTDLSDFPNAHQAGKILQSNGSRFEFIDLPAQQSTQPQSTNVDLSYKSATLSPNNGIDLSTDDSNFYIVLDATSMFKVQKDSGMNYKMKLFKEYNFIINLNSQFELKIDTIQFTFLGDKHTIFNGEDNKEFIKFSLLKVSEDTILFYNVSY